MFQRKLSRFAFIVVGVAGQENAHAIKVVAMALLLQRLVSGFWYLVFWYMVSAFRYLVSCGYGYLYLYLAIDSLVGIC